MPVRDFRQYHRRLNRLQRIHHPVIGHPLTGGSSQAPEGRTTPRSKCNNETVDGGARDRQSGPKRFVVRHEVKIIATKPLSLKPLSLWRSSAARHEQQVGGPIDEFGVCGVRQLEPLEFIGKLKVASRACRIPPKVRHEPTMKQVETSQILDIKTIDETAPQFGGCEQVKAECNTSSVAEFELASVPEVILCQFTDLLHRVYEGGWRAADRTYRSDEMSRGNTGDL